MYEKKLFSFDIYSINEKNNVREFKLCINSIGVSKRRINYSYMVKAHQIKQSVSWYVTVLVYGEFGLYFLPQVGLSGSS